MNRLMQIMAEYQITKTDLSLRFNIPLRTVQNWTADEEAPYYRQCPEYIVSMIDTIYCYEKKLIDYIARNAGV